MRLWFAGSIGCRDAAPSWLNRFDCEENSSLRRAKNERFPLKSGFRRQTGGPAHSAMATVLRRGLLGTTGRTRGCFTRSRIIAEHLLLHLFSETQRMHVRPYLFDVRQILLSYAARARISTTLKHFPR